MGIKTTKVWLVVAVCLVPWSAASLCPKGLQYWSNDSETCINCSRCDSSAKKVVIRPCQAHADTVCGPISDLDIDWSWLKRDDKDKQTHKHHAKHHAKKSHNHHDALDADMEKSFLHDSVLDDEVEMVPPVTHHNGHKHHKHDSKKIDEDFLDFVKKPSKNHHISSESFLSEDFDPLDQKTETLPTPPPLKSTHDLEEEWKEWLIRSKNRLQHRKDDLLKTLREESPYNEKHHSSLKLNHPSNSFDNYDEEIFHHGPHHKDHFHKKHFSPLDLEIFDKLLDHTHQKHEDHLSLSHLLEKIRSDDKKHVESKVMRDGDRGGDLAYPMDSFDFRSVAPTHRLFLGEPPTVSEIMDQDLSEESEDNEDESLKEDKMVWGSMGDTGVVAVPFSAAEQFVWDWQAVALTAAVAACLLFFIVVAVYSLVHARQWKRLKTNFDPVSDMEELSVKMGLMSGVSASAADAANTNVYLENLLENKKKSSNIYTEKRPLS